MLINLYFFQITNINDLVVFIIFVVLIISVLFSISNYFKGKHPYHSQQYWESRYSVINKRINWYIAFEEMREKFKLDVVFDSLNCDYKKSKILDLGCGNSSLAVDVKHNID